MNKKKNNDKRSYILTRETLGMTILLFCFILTVILLTNKVIFMDFGGAICTFMYGTFGYASYFIVALLAYLGEWLVFEKKLKINVRCLILSALTVFMLFLLFHAVTTRNYSMASYGGYLAQCFNNAAKGYSGYTFGGVISGLLVFPVAKGTTYVGAYVIFSLLTVACGAFAFLAVRSLVLGKMVARAHSSAKEVAAKEEEQPQPTESRADTPDKLYSVNENHEIVTNVKQGETVRPQTVKKPAQAAQPAEQKPSADRFSPENLGRRILFQNGEFAAESYRRNMIYNEDSYFNHPVQNEGDYMKSFSSNPAAPTSAQSVTPAEGTSYTDDYAADVENYGESESTPSYLYGDEPVQNLGDRPLYEEKPDAEEDFSSYTVDESASADFEEDERTEPQIIRDYSEPLVPRADNNPYSLRSDDEPTLPEPEHDEPETDSFIGGVTEEPEEPEPAPEEPAKPEEKPRERSSLFDLFSSSNPRLSSERRIEPDVSALQSDRRERSRENLFDDSEGNDNLFGDQTPLSDRSAESRETKSADPPARDRAAVNPPERTQFTPPVRESVRKEPAPKPEPEPVPEEKPKHVWKKYVRPSLDLLDDYPENTNVNTAEIEESKQIICETLADYRIESRISNVVVGPAITRYDVIIEDRTNIKNALKYREAIAMALMKENVNAYLNYSKGAISIEVPNSSRCVVGLKTMLASSVFLNSKPNSLTFTLGKNVEGQVVCPDITKMPHLLVAGTTGSGKSICLSTLIISLLYKYGPEELRFILVDPKQVEFISYDKLPHLMINEIIYDVDKAIKALNWAIKEMERRYQLFKEMTEKGVATKNLTEYNAHLPEGEEKLPKIVVILDEFGDLMLQAKKDIESRIIRLVQKSRACGIHLILATQRPSVDCITGLIKSNLPTRIGFKVNSFDDARCIFDIGGAEKLLGKGDLYFRSAENPELARIQGCFVDTHEVQKVTDFVKQNNETYFDQSVSDFINTVEEEPSDAAPEGGDMSGDVSKVDDTFIKALKFCVTSNQASVSMIQRRFPIGYMKACKIIDWMENMNYITQSEGSKPRKVLLSREEFIQRYGDVDD
ncbi:MAG: FtsK/SpoIIIE domain-containing protein [Clostridiales bacterium]|nr:FtsK/SpoIIIE domain-containing protein [Clostridiales bacterium]